MPSDKKKNGAALSDKKNGHGVAAVTGQEELSADRQRAVHERAPARILPREAARLERGHPQGGQGDAGASPGREREPSRPCRPRLLGNRPRDRAARARPPAQADRQDRRRARRASTTAPTATARRPASRSRCAGSRRARSRRCRSRRRSVTSGASASIATTRSSFGALRMPSFPRKRGTQSEQIAAFPLRGTRGMTRR